MSSDILVLSFAISLCKFSVFGFLIDRIATNNDGSEVEKKDTRLRKSVKNSIINGLDSDCKPFFVKIEVRKHPLDLTAMYFCGGTIIDSKWVITAASCVINVTGWFLFTVFVIFKEKIVNF